MDVTLENPVKRVPKVQGTDNVLISQAKGQSIGVKEGLNGLFLRDPSADYSL